MKKWVAERFEVYARACLIVAMIAAPTFFLKSTMGVFAIAKLVLLWSLATICLALWCIWRINEGTPLPKSRLIRYGACFVAISALATAFSPYRLTSLIGHYFVYGGLVSLEIYFVVAFLVFALYWKGPGSLVDLVKAGATAGFLVSGFQLLQEAGLDWHTWQLQGRVAPWEGGSLGNPNFTGGFLGATLPLALYLTVNSKEKAARNTLAALTAMQVLALWLTASRGGLAAGVAGCAVFAAPHVRKIPRSVKLRIAWALGALLVLAVVAISQAKDDPNVEGSEPTVLGVSVSPKALVDVRFDFWKTAVSIIADHRILGTGPDTYYANYPSKRPAENGADPTLQLENNPHNIFLAHGVGSGILGLGAYLLVVGSALHFAFRKIRDSADSGMKLLLLTFASVLVAYLTQGFVSIDHVPLAMLGWVSIGAIAVLAEPEAESAREALAARARASRGGRGAEKRSRRRLRVPVAFICLLALLLLSIGARFLVADKKAWESTRRDSVGDAMVLLRQSFELNPAEAEYHFLAGSELHGLGISSGGNLQIRRQVFEEARRQYLQALARRPRSVIFQVALARLDSAWGQLLDKQHFVTAGESWRRVIELDPHNYRWPIQYSDMLGASAKADNNNRQLRLAQIAEIRKSLDRLTYQPRGWQRLADAYDQMGDTAQAEKVRAEFKVIWTKAQEAAPDAPATPATAAAQRSALGGGVGMALAFGLPLLAGIIWMRRMNVTMRREKPKTKKKEVAPDRLHELIGATGAWSIAVGVPHAGALLGVGRISGELRELILHLIPGIAALVLAFVYASKPYVNDRRTGPLYTLAPFVTFVTSLVGIVVHLPELFSGKDAQGISAVLLHIAPLLAMFALVSLSISLRPPSVAPAPRAAKESVDIA